MNKNKFLLKSYTDIAPSGVVDLAYKLAENLIGKSFMHVNSTKMGGGVAEMLQRLIPMFNELGIKTRWEVIEGTSLFYKTTKCFHNALQGQEQNITQEMYEEYKKINDLNCKKILFDADFTIIHDPQPAAFINKKPKKSFWFWRY